MSPKSHDLGVTVIELVIAMLIIATLTSVLLPSYRQYIDDANNAEAIADILSIQMEIQRYHTETFRLPDNLADIGMENILDPWEHPYQYLKLTDGKGKGKDKDKGKGKGKNKDKGKG